MMSGRGLSESVGGGGESAPRPGEEVADIVVEPPELCPPPPPLDSGRFGDGGELGVETVSVPNSGLRFLAALLGVLKTMVIT